MGGTVEGVHGDGWMGKREERGRGRERGEKGQNKDERIEGREVEEGKKEREENKD